MGLEPIPAVNGRGQGTHVTRLTYRDKKTFTLTLTPTGKFTDYPKLPVFGLREEAGVPGGTQADTGRTRKLHIESSKPQPGIKLRTLLMVDEKTGI